MLEFQPWVGSSTHYLVSRWQWRKQTLTQTQRQHLPARRPILGPQRHRPHCSADQADRWLWSGWPVWL